jgi:hypothetical protein
MTLIPMKSWKIGLKMPNFDAALAVNITLITLLLVFM